MKKFFDLNDRELQDAFVEESVVADVQYEISRMMKDAGVSRAELARRLSVSAPHVTQMLSDEDANLTLRTLARIFDALGEAVVVRAKSSLAKCDYETKAAHIGRQNNDWSGIMPNDLWNVGGDAPQSVVIKDGCAIVWLDAVRKKAA